MICPNCEFEIEEGTELCPYCNMFVKQPGERVTGQGQPQFVSSSPAMTSDVYYTRKEFLDSPEMRPLKKSLQSGLTVLYVLIALNIIVSLMWFKSPIMVLCVLVLFGMALAVQFTHSRVCSLVLLFVFVANMIVGKIWSGRWSGYFGVINMLFVTMTLFQIHAKWKGYRNMQMAKNMNFL